MYFQIFPIGQLRDAPFRPLTRTQMKIQIRLPRLFVATLLLLAAATNSIQAADVPVTNTNDNGDGSLRQAIALANSGDRITFSLPANSAITLTSGELLINKNLTIAGPGANQLSVQRSTAAGTPNFRIFDIGGNGQVAISGLTISGGNVVGGIGGGIFNQSGTLLLNGVAISGNSSDQGGGGLANNGVVTISRSTISGNSASAGGGITGLGSFTIWDSTISGNTALTGIALGGGIRVGGFVDLINSTVAGNAAGDGGGIFNNGFISGTVSARNTIIALNTASSSPNVNGALTSKNFNLIGNSAGANITPPPSPSYDQTDVSAAELNLGPLQDNGGPTRTHALLSGSTAIDRGDFEGVTYDQRGPDFPRPVDSPALAGNGDGSDIGAYEVQADSLAGCVTLVENNNDSGPGSLRDAIADACAGSTISFAANVRGAITLTSHLSIEKRLTINGPGANQLTVQRSTASGTPAFPIFETSREHVTISGLAIANGSYAQGGGISTFSNLTINDCTILDNTANEGGGIYSHGGRLTINNSTISGNSAVGGGDGGGIYIDSSIVSESVTINNSTISGNSADGRGGGIYNLSELTINNSTISGNFAVAEAGGIANGNLVVIASSTITGNSGASGGGISALGGGNLGVRNSIIALNIERDPFSDFPDIDHRGGQGGSGGHNLIGELGEFEYEFERSTSDQIGTPASPIDPKLGPLQNNGGPTQTHALLSTSPAVDKGRSSGSLTDQRGLSRPIDDPGITNATGGDGADIGAFEVQAATPTPTPTATPTATPGLVGNVSTRLSVGTGDDALFGGFIVQGPPGSTKKIIVRALGPFLTQFGVTDALANPTLEIRDGTNLIVATNNDWRNTQVGGIITGDQAAEIEGSGLVPGNDLESAIIANLAPGNYTAVVRGVDNTVGTGIVDAFDMSGASPARLANVATRGLIQPGDKLMIAGFIIQNGSVRAVVRAIGPSLTQFGVTNALADTTLEVTNQDGTFVVTNDDWETDQKQELENTGLQPGNALEAALVTILPPGQYSALVRGKPESTGTGVAEVYFLQ
jgi:hypothetical protein